MKILHITRPSTTGSPRKSHRMPSSTVQSIGDRITYAWHEDALTIVITRLLPQPAADARKLVWLAGVAEHGYGDGRRHRQ